MPTTTTGTTSASQLPAWAETDDVRAAIERIIANPPFHATFCNRAGDMDFDWNTYVGEDVTILRLARVDWLREQSGIASQVGDRLGQAYEYIRLDDETPTVTFLIDAVLEQRVPA